MNVHYGQSTILNGRWKDGGVNKAKTPVLSLYCKEKRKTVNKTRSVLDGANFHRENGAGKGWGVQVEIYSR